MASTSRKTYTPGGKSNSGESTANSDRMKAPVVGTSLKDSGGGKKRTDMIGVRGTGYNTVTRAPPNLDHELLFMNQESSSVAKLHGVARGQGISRSGARSTGKSSSGKQRSTESIDEYRVRFDREISELCQTILTFKGRGRPLAIRVIEYGNELIDRMIHHGHQEHPTNLQNTTAELVDKALYRIFSAAIKEKDFEICEVCETVLGWDQKHQDSTQFKSLVNRHKQIKASTTTNIIALKDAAKALFMAGKYQDALLEYSRAHNRMRPFPTLTPTDKELWVSLACNVVVCLGKLEKWGNIMSWTRRILSHDPTVTKAVLWRSRAEEQLKLKSKSASKQKLESAETVINKQQQQTKPQIEDELRVLGRHDSPVTSATHGQTGDVLISGGKIISPVAIPLPMSGSEVRSDTSDSPAEPTQSSEPSPMLEPTPEKKPQITSEIGGINPDFDDQQRPTRDLKYASKHPVSSAYTPCWHSLQDKNSIAAQYIRAHKSSVMWPSSGSSGVFGLSQATPAKTVDGRRTAGVSIMEVIVDAVNDLLQKDLQDVSTVVFSSINTFSGLYSREKSSLSLLKKFTVGLPIILTSVWALTRSNVRKGGKRCGLSSNKRRALIFSLSNTVRGWLVRFEDHALVMGQGLVHGLFESNGYSLPDDYRVFLSSLLSWWGFKGLKVPPLDSIVSLDESNTGTILNIKPGFVTLKNILKKTSSSGDFTIKQQQLKKSELHRRNGWVREVYSDDLLNSYTKYFKQLDLRGAPWYAGLPSVFNPYRLDRVVKCNNSDGISPVILPVGYSIIPAPGEPSKYCVVERDNTQAIISIPYHSADNTLYGNRLHHYGEFYSAHILNSKPSLIRAGANGYLAQVCNEEVLTSDNDGQRTYVTVSSVAVLERGLISGTPLYDEEGRLVSYISSSLGECPLGGEKYAFSNYAYVSYKFLGPHTVAEKCMPMVYGSHQFSSKRHLLLHLKNVTDEGPYHTYIWRSGSKTQIHYVKGEMELSSFHIPLRTVC